MVRGIENSSCRSGALGRKGRHGWEPLAAWEELEGVGVHPEKVRSREKFSEAVFGCYLSVSGQVA